MKDVDGFDIELGHYVACCTPRNMHLGHVVGFTKYHVRVAFLDSCKKVYCGISNWKHERVIVINTIPISKEELAKIEKQANDEGIETPPVKPITAIPSIPE